MAEVKPSYDTKRQKLSEARKSSLKNRENMVK